MFVFTPENDSLDMMAVPYWEDARADYAPYYRSRSSIEAAKNEVVGEMSKLGGLVTAFRPGWFGSDRKRYGYEIHFLYNHAPAVIRVAGLPMKFDETEVKKAAIAVQALLVVRDWLKNAVTAQIFMPRSMVLMQFLLVPGSGQGSPLNLGEYLRETGQVPLALPSPVIETPVVTVE
jgi:hypothetical protein